MRSIPLFISKKTLLAAALGLSIAGTLAVLSPAHAQSVVLPGVTVTTSNTSPPPPGPIGLSVTGWQLSSGIGQGYNVGGDPAKGYVTTLADGFFNLSTESFLTGNSNPNCTTDCASTQAKLSIFGSQMTGARAFNEGVGTQLAPVVSVAGTNGMFSASLQTQWVYTAPPAQPNPAP